MTKTIYRGDKFGNIVELPTNGSLDIRPPRGCECTIHNMFWEGMVSLYLTNGSISVLIGSSTQVGSRLNENLGCTDTLYYTIKNDSSRPTVVGFMGAFTKVND